MTSPTPPVAPSEEEQQTAQLLLSQWIAGTVASPFKPWQEIAQALATARSSARSAALDSVLSTLRGFLALVEPEAAPGDERAQVMGIRRAIEVVEALKEP